LPERRTNRGARRTPSKPIPAADPTVDPAVLSDPRRIAYDVIRAVSIDEAYANLVLPKLLRERGVSGRDAAFATELAYGTLRSKGTLDRIIVSVAGRDLESIDRPVLDLVRLGAYQLLRTRVPVHAAVASTVDLSRSAGSPRASGFVNAVLRKVGAATWDEWTQRLARGSDELEAMALRYAHPRWIVEAFASALDGDLSETAAALEADDARPQTHLVAWPGRITASELAEQAGGEAAPEGGIRSPYAVRLTGGGDPGRLPAVRAGLAGVQDEGSQLCAAALAAAPLEGPDAAWADLCAGPGGKAALLGALAAARGASVLANELHPHRAQLVRDTLARAGGGWPVQVEVGDALALAGRFDRVLLDAPCTGLGALRRRPEARWRRTADDLADLVQLQAKLLAAALALARPGGLVAYVTCSPHPGETTAVLRAVLGESYRDTLVDARALFAPDGDIDALGRGPTVQLWPHRHGTDAMFFALVRAQ
jgi:16S rRNA (cytosine967-C5)-methyltransferase